MRVDRLDPDVAQQRQSRRRPHPAHPRRREVEAARVVRQPQRHVVVRVERIVARVPAGHVRPEPLGGRRAHGHERRPARRQQPLVGARHQEVEPPRFERQPPARLRRVHARQRAVMRGRRGDRVEVRHPPVDGLHGADRHERGGAVDRFGELIQRDGVHLQIGDEERPDHRGEVALGAHHPLASLQCQRHQPREGRDLTGDRDVARPPPRAGRPTPTATRRPPGPTRPSASGRGATRRARPRGPRTRAAAAARTRRRSGTWSPARRAGGPRRSSAGAQRTEAASAPRKSALAKRVAPSTSGGERSASRAPSSSPTAIIACAQ